MGNKKKSIGGQSGFTLIEVLIAVIVLAVGLLTIAAVFAQGSMILINTPVQLAAKEWAYEIIDDIAIRNDAGLSFPTSYAPKEINGKVLRAEVNIQNVGGGTDLRVDVTIRYPIKGNERRYETAVIISTIT